MEKLARHWNRLPRAVPHPWCVLKPRGCGSRGHRGGLRAPKAPFQPCPSMVPPVAGGKQSLSVPKPLGDRDEVPGHPSRALTEVPVPHPGDLLQPGCFPVHSLSFSWLISIKPCPCSGWSIIAELSSPTTKQLSFSQDCFSAEFPINCLFPSFLGLFLQTVTGAVIPGRQRQRAELGKSSSPYPALFAPLPVADVSQGKCYPVE